MIESGGAGGPLHGVPARAGGHFGGEGLQDTGHQLAAARADVDEGEFGGVGQCLVDEAQEPGHGPREQL